MKKLEKQLQMLPDLVSAYKTLQSLKVLKVTSVRTLCEIKQSVPVAQEMFCEVDKLLRIHLTILITTATAERSFSALCHVKTYLRSTMSEERLNNIMLLHVHKDLCDSTDLSKIAQMLCHATHEDKDILETL